MTDYILLEDGSGALEIEGGTDNYLLDLFIEQNNLNMGTDETAISAANSAASGQNALDLFYTNTAPVFDTAQSYSGGMSARTQHSGASGSSMVGWDFMSTPQRHWYSRFYMRVGALPASQVIVVRMGTDTDTAAENIYLTATGALRVGSGGPITTATIPLNTWVRVELMFDAVTDDVTLRYYATADAVVGSYTEQIAWTGTRILIGTIRYGVNASTNAGPFWFDEIIHGGGNPTWFGPIVSSGLSLTETPTDAEGLTDSALLQQGIASKPTDAFGLADTAQASLWTVLAHDDFTASDGTAIVGRATPVGGFSWIGEESNSTAWTIQSNRARYNVFNYNNILGLDYQTNPSRIKVTFTDIDFHAAGAGDSLYITLTYFQTVTRNLIVTLSKSGNLNITDGGNFPVTPNGLVTTGLTTTGDVVVQVENGVLEVWVTGVLAYRSTNTLGGPLRNKMTWQGQRDFSVDEIKIEVNPVIPVAQTDALGLSDSATIQIIKSEFPVDALGLVDSAQSSIGYLQLFVDAMGLADAAVASMAHTRLQTDIEGLTDSAVVSRGYGQNQTDIESLSDSVSIVVSQIVSQTDIEGLTDTTSLTQGHAKTQTDIEGLTDTVTPSMGHIRSITDAENLSDSAVVSIARLYSNLDAIGLSDSTIVQLLVNYFESVSDPEGLSDSILLEISKAVSTTDILGLSDSINTSLAYLRSQTDLLGLTDSTAFFQSHIQSQTDVENVNDSVSIILGQAVTQTDIQGLTDSTSFVLSKAVNPTDVENLTDTFAAAMAHVRSVTDAEALNDTTVTALAHLYTKLDAIGLSDSAIVQLLVNYQQSAFDTETLTDSVLFELSKAVSTADVLGMADSLAASLAHLRTQIDSINLTDTTVFNLGYNLISTDSLDILDSAVIGLGDIDYYTDVLGLTDSASVIVGIESTIYQASTIFAVIGASSAKSGSWVPTTQQYASGGTWS